jgi:hypothetical protein
LKNRGVRRWRTPVVEHRRRYLQASALYVTGGARVSTNPRRNGRDPLKVEGAREDP